MCAALQLPRPEVQGGHGPRGGLQGAGAGQQVGQSHAPRATRPLLPSCPATSLAGTESAALRAPRPAAHAHLYVPHAGRSQRVGFLSLTLLLLLRSFTLEASFAGASTGRWARQHFSTMHLELQVRLGHPHLALPKHWHSAVPFQLLLAPQPPLNHPCNHPPTARAPRWLSAYWTTPTRRTGVTLKRSHS